MSFWLTVRTGISDPELVFDFHSSPPLMSELVPVHENSMDSIPADKVLKKTRLDLQKRFPTYLCGEEEGEGGGGGCGVCGEVCVVVCVLRDACALKRSRVYVQNAPVCVPSKRPHV